MKRPEQGYALIVVLGGLVLLALVAAALDARIERWRDSQRGWGKWVSAGVDLESARDEVLALILTLPMGPQGFGALRVDGRHYVLPSGVRFSVQDQRGLLSVADAQQPLILRNWLARQGLGAAEVDSLVDKLADYADADPLRRLNGAEAPDYQAAGLAPPRNDWLMSPYELRRVMGWHARQALWQRASDWASATREPWLNPNTAPAELLYALPGAKPEQVVALLQLRERQHIDSAATLAALTGLQLSEDTPAYYPGHLYRVRLWLAGGARTLEYTVMLTPEAPAQPWAVLDVRHLPPEPEDVKPPLPAPKLPGRADPRTDSLRKRWLAPTRHGLAGQRLGTRWWGRHVLARGLCRLRLLPLDDIPQRDRLGRVRVEMAAWQPFEQTGVCAVLQADQALLYGWDDTALQQRLSAGGDRLPVRQVLPESLLQPPGDGLRRLVLDEGEELQWWQEGQLRASRWWPQAPNPEQWQAFCRGIGLRELPPLPAAQDLPLQAAMPRAWGSLYQAGASGSLPWRTVLHALAAASVLGACTLGADLTRQAWDQAQEAKTLEADLARLRAELEPIATARREALALRVGVQAASDWMQQPEALSLLAHLASRLPPDGSKLRLFDWNDEQLTLSLDPAAGTPRVVYVQALEEGGWFEQVREQSQEGAGALALVTRLRGARPAASAASATESTP